MEKVTAVLLLGGTGSRFTSDIPKQFAKLGGKDIFMHTVEAFEPHVDELILVCHPQWVSYVFERTSHTVIEGGPTRQQSSFNGVSAASHDIVLVHDAVRPFVSPRIIKESIEHIRSHGACDVCIPSTDTIVQGGTFIASIPERSSYLRGQTPQGFQKELLLKAHSLTTKENATDDCQLVHELGHPISIVTGDERNIKITTQLDLTLAEQLLKQKRLETSELLSITGKTYVVIGGTGGIGSALVDALQKAGAHPISLSLSSGFDATHEASAQSFFEEMGPIDGVVCAQGFLSVSDIRTSSSDMITSTIDVNFTSLVYIAKHAQIKPGGHILNIASSSYSSGRAGYAIYSATKAAVVNFTGGLALERPDIHVNALVPGRTETPMRKRNFGEESNLLLPQEVAEEAVVLLSQTGVTGIFHEVKKGAFGRSSPGQKKDRTVVRS